MKQRPFTLGDFQPYYYWREAIRLLNYQIELRGTNRTFNTLSMFYYERLDGVRDTIAGEDYFKESVANNVFYALESEFASMQYLLPKNDISHRKHLFMTYPLRVLYYAIGLYLVRSTEDFVAYVKNNVKNVHFYYGGKLHFKDGCVVCNKKSVLYYNDYKAFRGRVRKYLAGDVDDRVVIRLDVQNYFNTVSVSRLLQMLSKSMKYSIQSSFKFGNAAQEEIASFFEYMLHSNHGIPIADNDIIASFLGNLYLMFGDLGIDNVLRSHCHDIESFEIVRYVDDIYVAVNFHGDIGVSDRVAKVRSILAAIIDFFAEVLDLQFNSKSEVFWLARDEDRSELCRSLKRTSPDYHILDDDREAPMAKVDNILKAIDDIKREGATLVSGDDKGLRGEILKDVFDPAVQQILKSPGYLERLESVFSDFDFGLAYTASLEITTLIFCSEFCRERLRRFLLLRPGVTIRDTGLILRYLCSSEFSDAELKKKLAESRSLKSIMSIFDRKCYESEYPGYYKLHVQKCRELAKMPHAVEQIKRRVICERAGMYSVALNHLLNEVHSIAKSCDPSADNEGNEYKADDVVRFCRTRGMPNEMVMAIRNLFDLRNMNVVSHPGHDGRAAAGISQSDYREWRIHVGNGLEFIL
jgi:AbiA family abortive infection protein